MWLAVAPELLVGAATLGLVHGAEPGHGWPVAATYALDRSNSYVAGLVASLVIGLGHLVSSLAVVGVFFLAKSHFALTRLTEPVSVAGLQLGGPIGIAAGVLLVALGVREYRGGHVHGHSGDHADHEHGDGDHEHDHHSHDWGQAREGGLLGLAWAAFLLGFAHEEEFEVIAICAGSAYCLELMVAYAATVVLGIVGLTMLLLVGYHRFEERVTAYTPYLSVLSAVVLVGMGLGFVFGLL